MTIDELLAVTDEPRPADLSELDDRINEFNADPALCDDRQLPHEAFGNFHGEIYVIEKIARWAWFVTECAFVSYP